ncbi:hypothetical protein CR513_00115, partial [Mucuna pruriens]
MEMFNLASKLKSLKLELGQDLPNKKGKSTKGVAEGSSQQKNPKEDKEFTYYFCKKSRHMKKHCFNYLYLIHERSQSLDIFKSFKVQVELQLGKKIKVVKFGCGGEYYGIYDGSGEQRPGPFALFLNECGIILQYTMSGKPSMNVEFKKDNVNDIGQVLVPIIVQETTLIIEDIIQTIVPDIVLEQDYDEVLYQIPIEQPQ